MIEYKFQIIETVVLVIIFIITLNAIQSIINKVGQKYSYHEGRIKILKKAISYFMYLVFVGTLILIWGIEPSQVTAYIASLFTVLGIAFLAQWSIISNITSTLIVFFNHQVNIGDTVVILDKDFNVEGTISDIGIFFIIIKVSDNEYVSLPSNVFMQKMVKKIKA